MSAWAPGAYGEHGRRAGKQGRGGAARGCFRARGDRAVASSGRHEGGVGGPEKEGRPRGGTHRPRACVVCGEQGTGEDRARSSHLLAARFCFSEPGPARLDPAPQNLAPPTLTPPLRAGPAQQPPSGPGPALPAPQTQPAPQAPRPLFLRPGPAPSDLTAPQPRPQALALPLRPRPSSCSPGSLAALLPNHALLATCCPPLFLPCARCPGTSLFAPFGPRFPPTAPAGTPARLACIPFSGRRPAAP